MADNFMDSYKDDVLDDEPMEPELTVAETRIAIFFTSEEPREALDDIVAVVIGFAEQNGLTFDWGAVEAPTEPATTPPTPT